MHETSFSKVQLKMFPCILIHPNLILSADHTEFYVDELMLLMSINSTNVIFSDSYVLTKCLPPKDIGFIDAKQ